MNNDGADRTLRLVDVGRIEDLREDFKRAWSAGLTPLIEEYLNRLEEGFRSAAFKELLTAEIYLRRGRQEAVASEDYLGRFPEYRQNVLDVFRDLYSPAATVALNTLKLGSGLQIRCPHCHNPVELLADEDLDCISCGSCGSNFSLTDDKHGATRDGRTFAQVGHFKLVERLGMGAFGTVWKALDLELDRTVAIKIPRSSQLDKQRQDFFFREARSAAQLRHPNIVPVYEVGRDGDTLYIVSELVRGVTLSDRLAAGPMASREAAELCEKIGGALHHAHERGVIHRDLKPANVMIDDAGEPHLMDFGLARREANEITMTVQGQVLGTPAYMSPEQAKGEAHGADRRSDIYSLGVVLFELLTGELPFRGNLRMLIQQVINDDPPSPRKLNANIQKDLETITIKCLEKQPAKRYDTALSLAEELARFRKGIPILARPVSRFERARRWTGRHRTVAALLFTIFLALAGGAAVSTFFGLNAIRARNVADQNLSESRANERRALRNLSGSLAAQALTEFNRSPQRGVLIAAEAVNLCRANGLSPLPMAEECLRFCVQNHGCITLRGHRGAVGVTIFSPDGRWLATGDDRGGMQLWDLNASRPETSVRALPGHQRAVWEAAVSQDSRWLASAGADGAVRLWDLTANEPAASVRILSRHTADVNDLAFTPDGRWLASCGSDQTVCLWDLTAPDPTAAPIVAVEHHGSIQSLAISPDGHWLATGGADGVARLWDLTQLAQRTVPLKSLELKGHKGAIRDVAICPESRWLVTAGKDGVARLWDLHSSTPELAPIALEGHQGFIEALCIAPNGRWLVTCSWDRTARLWDLTTVDPAPTGRELPGHAGIVWSADISSDSRWLITGSADGTARRWDLSCPDPASASVVIPIQEGYVGAVAIDPKGRYFVTGSEYDAAQLWTLAKSDPGKSALVFKSSRHCDSVASAVNAAAISPDGRWLATGDDVGTARIWDLKARFPEATERELRGHKSGIRALVFSGDGNAIYTGAKDHTVRRWDPRESDPNITVQLVGRLGKAVDALALDPDSRWLAASDRTKTLHLLDLSSNQRPSPVRKLVGPQVPILCAIFSSDGEWLVAGSMDSKAYLWNLDGTLAAHSTVKMPVAEKIRHTNVQALAISPDDRWLFTGTKNSLVGMWDLSRTGVHKSVNIFKGHQLDITALLVSPDGKHMISASRDGQARIWSLGAATEKQEPRVLSVVSEGAAESSQISVLAISRDSRWLVTGGKDSIVRLWDLHDAHPETSGRRLTGHTGPITSLAITSDDRWILSSSEDGSARLWPLAVDALFEQAARSVGRNFTPAEWESIFHGEMEYRATFEGLRDQGRESTPK